MKKILLLLSFFSFSFSYSQDWKLILETKSENHYYKPNTKETAWIKIVSDKTKYFQNKSSQTVDGFKILLWKFDCESKKIGLIQVIVYSKDGDVLETHEENELLVNMSYVTPDSVGEMYLKLFCAVK